MSAWGLLAHEPRAGTAYHEAGHAVMSHALGWQIERASILPEAGAAGHVAFKSGDRVLVDAAGFPYLAVLGGLQALAVAVAGAAAERLATGSCRYGWSSLDCDADQAQAAGAAIATAVCAPLTWGAGLQRAVESAAELFLQREWETVERVAGAMLERSTLDAADAAALMAGVPAPDLGAAQALAYHLWSRFGAHRQAVPA